MSTRKCNCRKCAIVLQRVINMSPSSLSRRGSTDIGAAQRRYLHVLTGATGPRQFTDRRRNVNGLRCGIVLARAKGCPPLVKGCVRRVTEWRNVARPIDG